MEQVSICYLTDNEDGKKTAVSIRELGLNLKLIQDNNLKSVNISSNVINIFIIDCKKLELSKIMALFRDEQRLHEYLTFIILYKRQVRKALNLSHNLLHVEFISRPVNNREFMLLIEKSVIVERYREVMSFISKDFEVKIEACENLMDIHRKDVFDFENEKEAFDKIVKFEKHLMNEQEMLSKVIKEFILLRQREMFDIKNRVMAEEMLAELRRRELIDAESVIKAQESVIDFSSKRLRDANDIIKATENAVEFGRLEAIQLHEEMKKEREKNKILLKEIESLKKKVEFIKNK